MTKRRWLLHAESMRCPRISRAHQPPSLGGRVVRASSACPNRSRPERMASWRSAEMSAGFIWAKRRGRDARVPSHDTNDGSLDVCSPFASERSQDADSVQCSNSRGGALCRLRREDQSRDDDAAGCSTSASGQSRWGPGGGASTCASASRPCSRSTCRSASSGGSRRKARRTRWCARNHRAACGGDETDCAGCRGSQ